jgi:serine O-acetyltransferase
MISPERIHRIGARFVKSKAMARFFYLLNRWLNGCHIHPACKLKRSTRFIHGGMGIVLNRNVQFGENLAIYQNVTIGNDGNGGNPRIGDNVTIYANSVVVGDITIGDNVVIGALTFINKSLPPNTTWVGSPARCIGGIK